MIFCWAGVERGEDGVSVSQIGTSTRHKIVDTTGDTLVFRLADRLLIGMSRMELYFRIQGSED